MATKKRSVKKPERDFVIVRCRDAGVHAGYLAKADAQHITLIDSRRVWHWRGAATLSEVAVYGLNPQKSGGSRIGVKLPKLLLRTSDHCEVIFCTPAGRASIEGQPEWRA